MIDLTTALETQHSEFYGSPEFHRRVGDWTDAKLRILLDKHGIEHDGKFKLVTDAVRTEPSFLTLFGEYNKYLLRRLAVWADL